jgi:hypothetical protein
LDDFFPPTPHSHPNRANRQSPTRLYPAAPQAKNTKRTDCSPLPSSPPQGTQVLHRKSSTARDTSPFSVAISVFSGIYASLQRKTGNIAGRWQCCLLLLRFGEIQLSRGAPVQTHFFFKFVQSFVTTSKVSGGRPKFRFLDAIDSNGAHGLFE